MGRLRTGRYRCKAIDNSFVLAHSGDEGHIRAVMTWECIAGGNMGDAIAQSIALTASERSFKYGLAVLTAAGWRGDFTDQLLPLPVDIEVQEHEYRGRIRWRVSHVWPAKSRIAKYEPDNPLSSDEVKSFQLIHRAQTIEALEVLRAEEFARLKRIRERLRLRRIANSIHCDDEDEAAGLVNRWGDGD